MRPLLLLALAPIVCAAAALQVVRPVISQMDGGPPDEAGFQHVAGEILFFSCRVANYAKTPEQKIHIAYSVQAFDPKGVPLDQIYRNDMMDEVGPQDKDWTPKIATEVSIPPRVAPGNYKIVVKVEDLIAKTGAELEIPFRVRGREVAPSDTLVVRNFRFFRNENDTRPVDQAVYRPGNGVWTKFDITGFKYGPGNKIDVSYLTSVLNSAGKVLWTQPEPAVEQSESFYPKPYIAADFGLNLQGNIKPGEYTIAVTVKDAIGSQSFEIKQTFTVE
ncbi:MAG TPA: hypothetical protein VGS58_07765 [Candidatus Sulfopaludibacter sp.]|nr:hypothetical protein [Candidatus Sulfopaludibacter sp.]